MEKVSGLDVIWVFTSHNIRHSMPSIEVGWSSWRHILPSHSLKRSNNMSDHPKHTAVTL
ncbi:hypothetical protein DAPPUDRAFT_313574 [Daphnia pulex]|uniref:Uncharacterized protein n=1 Tax=Daphnia pulex TaxID=6669 RepID=E9G3I4_DAPPU|nr:hypothetical protein DAPPUDRAFT_313574 [Daphnia pulex]|eukprot:EFX85779.1 hypothetical protein DAPPUDRAFT_313574 [Daphnia pulex]